MGLRPTWLLEACSTLLNHIELIVKVDPGHFSHEPLINYFILIFFFGGGGIGFLNISSGFTFNLLDFIF